MKIILSFIALAVISLLLVIGSVKLAFCEMLIPIHISWTYPTDIPEFNADGEFVINAANGKTVIVSDPAAREKDLDVPLNLGINKVTMSARVGEVVSEKSVPFDVERVLPAPTAVTGTPTNIE